MRIDANTRKVVGCFIVLGAVLGALLSGCAGESVGRETRPQNPIQTADSEPAEAVKASDDPAQVKAFMGDLLYTDRYPAAMSERQRLQYRETDIGSPVVIAAARSGEEIAYLPLLRAGKMVAAGSITLSGDRMQFRSIQAADPSVEALFDVSREGLTQRLQTDGLSLASYEFLIDPTLTGGADGDVLPLCQVKTAEGQKRFYLYDEDRFITSAELARTILQGKRMPREETQ